MRTKVASAIILLFQFTLQAQFSKIDVNIDQGIPSNTEVMSTESVDMVALSGGELYHLTPKNDTTYQFAILDGTLPNIKKFILHDIDRDGDKDLLCNRIGENTIHVYVKQDDKFQYKPDWNFNGGSDYLVSGDFNGDGFDDLIIDFDIYISTGINTRQFAAEFSPNPSPSIRNLHYWDYNLDADNDVIINTSSNLVVYENSGSKTMNIGASIDIDFTSITWSALIKTTQGPRYIFYDTDADSISMLSWNGLDFEVKNLVYMPGSFSKGNIQYDLNADGNEEIIIYNNGIVNIFNFDPVTDSGSITTFNGGGIITGVVKDSNGTFICSGNATRITLVELGANFEVVHTYISNIDVVTANRGFGDFDGDGLVDILSTSSVKRYLDQGVFESLRPVLYPSSTGEMSDKDGDGDLDFIQDDNWYENLGNYTFGTANPIINNDPTPEPNIQFTREVLRKDMDGDGDFDILTYNHFGEPLQLLKNKSNLFFESPITIATNVEISGDELYIKAHDLDNDGDLDILMAAASGVIIIKGNPGLMFDPPIVLYDTDQNPITLEVDDINADGFPDILLGTRLFQAGSVYGQAIFFMGNADIPAPTMIHSGGGSHRAAFANLDNEGWKDIVTLHYGGLFWHKTTNGASFITDQIDTDYILNEEIFVADVNADGDDDIILSIGNDIYYYLNNDDEVTLTGCPDYDLYYFNQTQVDRYKSKYGSCKKLMGGLHLYRDYSDNEYIDDISSFQNIREIKGDFKLKGFGAYPDLTGFSHLERVEGDVSLENSHQYSFHGIDQLRFVGGDFTLKNMSTLSLPSDLAEFSNLDTLLGGIYLVNVGVTTLKPLIHNVIYGDFTLKDVRNLINQDSLEVLDTIYGTLTIENTLLTTLTGFANLKQVHGIDIRNNNFLTEIDILNDLDELNGNFNVLGNPLLIADDGFDSIKRIAGNVLIYPSKFDLSCSNIMIMFNV